MLKHGIPLNRKELDDIERKFFRTWLHMSKQIYLIEWNKIDRDRLIKGQENICQIEE